MHFGAIKKFDVANGPGVRVSFFVSGCTNRCKNCFQPETWDFNYGQEYTEAIEEEIIASLASPYIKGLTLLGGEPMELANQHALLPLVRRVRQVYPKKSIWCFTGFVLDQDLVKGGKRYGQDTDELLSYLDVLVDGRYEEELHDITLRFRGSSNQRLIDMKQTIAHKKVILVDETTL